MTRRSSRLTGRATDREVGGVAAVLATGSDKAAAHRLGLSHSTVKHHPANARSKVGVANTAQLVWILAPRLPDPEGVAQPDDQSRLPGSSWGRPVVSNPSLRTSSPLAPAARLDSAARVATGMSPGPP